MGRVTPHSKLAGRSTSSREPHSVQFAANAGVVVHPGQEIGILRGPVILGAQQRPRVSKIVYRLFAETMVPKEATLEL